MKSAKSGGWRFDLAVLAAAALLHGLLFWIGEHPAPRRLVGDERMYFEHARAAGVSSIDIFWPPFYVWFLRPFSPLGESVRIDVTLAQIGLLLLAAFALRSLAARLTGSERIGRWAWGLLLVDPQVAAFAHYAWPEILHLALFLGAVWALAARAQRWPWLVAAGLLLGIALLTKGILLPFVPVLLAALVLDLGWRRGMPRMLIVATVVAAVVLPTVLENGRRHGAYVIAGSGRYNLWLGLNDVGRHSSLHGLGDQEFPRFREGGGTFRERQAALGAKLDALWRERGSLDLLRSQLGKQYFRLFDKDSLLTGQLPGGAIAARPDAGYASTNPLASTVLRAWSFAVYALVLALAGPGLLATRLHGRPWLAALWLFIAYNLVLFLGLHVKSRFRVQFIPVLDLAAAVTLAWLVRSAGGDERRLLARQRVSFGVALSGVFLFLAFAGPFIP